MIRRIWMLSLIALGAGASTIPAAGAAVWTLTPLPRLHNGRGTDAFGQLLGISCLSSRWCAAVGDQGIRFTSTLVEHWNGSHWSRGSAPSVARSSDTTLTAISCTSQSDCWSVGDYVKARGSRPIIEHWDGRRWSVRPSPSIVGGLASVSCSRAATCIAVGFRGTDPSKPSTTPLIERLIGTRWRLQHASAGASGPLQSLSCPSATTCTAVGNQESFQHSSEEFFNDTLVQRWDGTRWSAQTPLQVAGPSSTGLVAVGCPTITACVATGFEVGQATQQAVAEAWDGTTWSAQPIDIPPSVTSSMLLGMSCASTTACAAVGGYQDSSGGQGPLAAWWDGASWELTPLGSTRQIFPTFQLNAVSCPAAGWCMAVGDAYATRSS